MKYLEVTEGGRIILTQSLMQELGVEKGGKVAYVEMTGGARLYHPDKAPKAAPVKSKTASKPKPKSTSSTKSKSSSSKSKGGWKLNISKNLV